MADDAALAGSGDVAALRARIARLEAELEEARHAVGALRHSEGLYRRLVELSPDAIYVHDDHRRIVFMNAAGVRLFGADSPEQLIGGLAVSLFHPDSRPAVAMDLDRVLERRFTAVHQERRCLRLDGSNFHADVAAAAIDWAGRPAGLVVVRDISDRIEADARAAAAESRSREAHARLVDAINAMSGGFALFDADERLVLCNRYYAEEIWPQCADIIRPGMAFETLVEETLRRGVWDAAGDGKEALAAAALTRHRNLPSESEIAYPDGHWMWQSKRRTSDGGVVAVYTDLTEVKERERLLAEREAQLRSLLESLPDAVLIHVDERVVFVNAAAVRMFGATGADQLLQSYSMQLVPPECVALQRERRRQVLEEKRFLPPIEQQRYRFDGTMFDVETAATYLLWEGRPAFVGVMRDITGRKQAEAALAEAHRRFSAITANIPGAVYQCVLTPDGAVRFPYFSAGVLGITGRAAEEIMADSAAFSGMLRPDFRETYLRRLRESALALDPFDLQMPIVRRDGVDRWVRARARPHRQPDGAVVWDGMFVDVTERMKAEERLRESEERYRKLIDMTPDSIYVHKAGRIVLSNDAAARLFGAASRDDMLGISTLDLVHADFREMVQRRQGLIVSAGTRTTFMRQKRLRLDGTEFWAEVAAAGVEWDGVRGGIVVLRDVTEQIEAAELLRHSKEEAELASRAKTEFLANVSHELRTPLNAIIGFSDIIQREMFGPLGNESYLAYARDIFQSGAHLHELINDILDLSKIEAGKLELQEEEIDIARAAARCLRLVQPRAEAGRVALETVIGETLPPVRADERKMKQIMLNLLSNAVKFTEPGGSVRLMIDLVPGGGLRIVVADTGIGMDAEGMKVALQPFGQADSALNRKYEGTGLGLPLTRALVDLHGGEFEIASTLGEGTCVTVSLPASRVLPVSPPASTGG
jgi:PAS domain S-box-containing protein